MGRDLNPVARLRRSLAMRGARGTIEILARHPLAPVRELREWRFDRKYGVDTRGELEFDEYATEGIELDHAESYMPIQPGRLRDCLALAGVPCRDRVFVDLGSGKGRALMHAAAHPFRRFVGVEISPELHDVARRNLDVFARRTGERRAFDLFCADASTFTLPREDMVVYLFNPFHGPILEGVVARMEEALADGVGALTVLFFSPEEVAALDEATFLTRTAVRADCIVYSADTNPIGAREQSKA